MEKLLDSIPLLLIYIRLALSPLMIFMALYSGSHTGKLIVLLLFIGVITDIFDGIIARKRRVSTTRLRKLDSNIDILFFLSGLVSAYILNPQIIIEKLPFVILLISLEIFTYIQCLLKFRKTPSNHSYLTKAWGISILISLSFIVWTDYTGIAFYIMFGLGVISYIDGIGIIAVLTRWQSDVPSLFHALKIRRINLQKTAQF